MREKFLPFPPFCFFFIFFSIRFSVVIARESLPSSSLLLRAFPLAPLLSLLPSQPSTLEWATQQHQSKTPGIHHHALPRLQLAKFVSRRGAASRSPLLLSTRHAPEPTPKPTPTATPPAATRLPPPPPPGTRPIPRKQRPPSPPLFLPSVFPQTHNSCHRQDLGSGLPQATRPRVSVSCPRPAI